MAAAASLPNKLALNCYICKACIICPSEDGILHVSKANHSQYLGDPIHCRKGDKTTRRHRVTGAPITVTRQVLPLRTPFTAQPASYIPAELSPHNPWVKAIHCNLCGGLQTPCELICEQHIGKLGLAISLPWVIGPRCLQHDVVEVHLPKEMSS
jgi:hypothetical protein